MHPTAWSRRSLIRLLGCQAALESPRLHGQDVNPPQKQVTPAGPPRFGDGRDWFFQKRFGLFIHWGVYAIPAWHEQHMYRLGLTREQYEPLARQFNPTRFNPDTWLDAAQAAGMEYLCFTAKHIDGFCMWDTRETTFNVMHTPYAKDIARQIADACHRRGIPLEFYYSVVDGHHPNYPNAGRAHEIKPPATDRPDLARYIEFVKRQLRELCTNYGEVHGIWFDANRTGYRDLSIRQMIRSLQPKAVINNRGFDDGDYGTPERDWDTSLNTSVVFDKPVEACQSVGYQSWGYRKDEDYYTPDHLIQSIHKVMAKGGNYLLNVGPMADGALPPEALHLLQIIGAWYRKAKESLLDVEPGPRLSAAPDLIATRRANVLYVHLVAPSQTAAVYLHPIDQMPQEAVLLRSGAKLTYDVSALPRFFNQKPSKSLRLRCVADTKPGDVIKLTFARS